MSAPNGSQRPRLVAVPGGEGAAEGAPPAAASGPPPAVRRPWLAIVLMAALALCGAALLAQARQADALRAQLALVEGRLARAEARLDAWRLWAGDVRDHAARLRAELGGLDAALARDPEATGGAPAAPAPEAPPRP